MVRTGKVVAIEKTDKQYIVKYHDHVSNTMKKMSLFIKDDLAKVAGELVQDDIIEFEWDTSSGSPKLSSLGKQVTKPGNIPVVPSTSSKGYSRHTPEERLSIERQSSIKAAVELFAAAGIKVKTIEDAVEAVISTAKEFNKYISNIE